MESSGPTSRPSLMVLPFVNLTGDAANGILADGVTEQLTSALAQLEDGFVVARKPPATRGGNTASVAELGIRFVVKGSVRTTGAGLRVNAQLIDVANDQPLWVERCDVVADDPLSMQREVADRLIPPLRAHLLTASGRARQSASERGEALMHPRGGTVVYPRGTEAPANVRAAAAARAEALAARATRQAANPDGARRPRPAAAVRRRFRIPLWFKLLVVALAGAAAAVKLGAQRNSVVEIVSWALIAAGAIQMLGALMTGPRAD